MARMNARLFAATIAGACLLGAAYIAFDAFILGGDESSQEATAIAPGFVGTAEFGAWDLVCDPGAEERIAPPPLDRPDPAASEEAPKPACRLRHEVVETDPSAHVVLSMNLSLAGPSRRPALMLRLPATLKAGDRVTLNAGREFTLDTEVRNCDAQECVAADSLDDEAWMHLIGAEGLEVVFPFDETQRVSVAVSTDGLSAAAAALETAIGE